MDPSLLSRVVLFSLLGTSLACSRKDVVVEAAPGAAAVADQVVAEVDGRRITLEELDEHVAGQLSPLNQQIFDVRSEGLKDMIGEALVEKEARRRGLTVADLMAAEVDAKVSHPSPQQLAQVYEANKARFVSVGQEQAYHQIESVLREQAETTRRREFRQELIQKASVQTNLQPPRVKVEVPKGAPSLGPADAKVTIVAFIDYQCPYCHRSQEAIERLMGEYKGSVRLVHQDFPLDIHERAFAASQAARCAGDQGKFWDYHRNLLTARGSFDTADLKERAVALGLNATAFATCLSSRRYDAEIKASLDRGLKLGVNSTPTFFINGRRLIGARPYEDFQAVVADESTGS